MTHLKRFLLKTIAFSLTSLSLSATAFGMATDYVTCNTASEEELIEVLKKPDVYCKKTDADGRYVIEITKKMKLTKPIKLESPNYKFHFAPFVKGQGYGFIMDNDFDNSKSYAISINSDNNVFEDLVLECSGACPSLTLAIHGKSNIVSGNIIINASNGIVLYNLDNSIQNNTISSLVQYGLWVNGSDLLAELKNNDVLLASLICSNQITASGKAKKTNLDLNDNKIDDYDEYYNQGASDSVSKCDTWKVVQQCGIGASSVADDGKCVCANSYAWDESGKCSVFCNQENSFIKDNTCILCTGEHKTVKDGVCQCEDKFEEWPAASGACVAKCEKEKGEIRDAEGKCVNECSYDNTEKSESAGACVCLNGYASYEGLNNVPCVKCGSYGYLQNGQCVCNNGFHVSLNGSCVSDSLSCLDDDQNAILEDKKCVCRSQFAYKTDPNDKPICEQIPCPADTEYYEAKAACLGPDIIACIEKGNEWDDGAGKCVGAAASGDCNCNFTGGEPTVAQALIPFIAVLFGTSGLFVWRKSKKL